MKIYDISVPLSEQTLVWPGDPVIQMKRTLELKKGDAVNMTKILMGTHSGTHMDAPAHFLKHGRNIDKINLKNLIGRCYVKKISGNKILKEHIMNLDLKGYQGLFFITNNTRRKLLFKKHFVKDYIGLSLEAAREIIRKKIKVIGIDYLSIEPYGNIGQVHKTLLKKGVIIIETLDMRRIKEGSYDFLALPLKMKKGDGAPSRVVLIKDFGK